jgi:hypothetical protein
MHEQEATKEVTSAISVTREDIARAKHFLLQTQGGKTDDLADRWVQEQNLTLPSKIDGDASNIADVLANVARGISLRLALYQAVAELVSACELIASGPPTNWRPRMDYYYRRQGGGLQPKIVCSFPLTVELPPLRNQPTTDTDIFLQGPNVATLHDGIKEAIEQALVCFRRGLYMPATAMLAAGVEATWTECGESVMSDTFSSISKIVTETCKALEQPDGKNLLKGAGQHISKVNEAQVWTDTLRDRRNALHWGKAKSFVADHSETATLLMAAPQHLGTLEAIRGAC